MKAASALGKCWRFSAMALLLVVSVACGNGNDKGQNPTPSPTPDPVATAPGDFAVTKFVLTNTVNASDMVDGDSFGLSIYFTLNGDGSLTGRAQIPNEPPSPTDFTGSWELNNGVLTFSFVDGDGNERTVSGALGFDADGDVVFVGNQTGGEPVEIGSADTYVVSSIEMTKIEPDVTNAVLAGEWTAVSGTAFSNLDPDIQENVLEGGAGVRIVFEENGSVTVFNTLPGGGQDNFATTYTLIDNFNFSLVIDSEDVSVVYRLVDDVLTLYIYSDVERNFDNDSTVDPVPATQVFVLERT